MSCVLHRNVTSFSFFCAVDIKPKQNKTTMKRLLLALLATGLALTGQAQVRNEIHVPDLGGYTTLKCDFHMHTVYSDGRVWPTVRVDEAWREGLDAIALTEHIEYRPHKDVTGHHGRSYEIAEEAARKSGILLIRGSEITRSMAPGHFNAIFLADCNPLDQKDWHDSFGEADRQDAFIFWNHPGWDSQQPDTTLWWDEHTEIYDNGWMDGIEVANGIDYFPEAHRWCLEKGLTMLGNSDVHNPIGMDFDFYKGEHRVMTLVLASERSLAGIREALDNRRTIVWIRDLLIGEEKWLHELFEKSVQVVDVQRGEGSCTITLQNTSDFPFHLKKTEHDKSFEYFRTYTIEPQSRHTIRVRFPKDYRGEGKINFRVTNLLAQPGQGMDYSYTF